MKCKDSIVKFPFTNLEQFTAISEYFKQVFGLKLSHKQILESAITKHKHFPTANTKIKIPAMNIQSFPSGF
jgi:hypothetical protein